MRLRQTGLRGLNTVRIVCLTAYSPKPALLLTRSISVDKTFHIYCVSTSLSSEGFTNQSGRWLIVGGLPGPP